MLSYYLWDAVKEKRYVGKPELIKHLKPNVHDELYPKIGPLKRDIVRPAMAFIWME